MCVIVVVVLIVVDLNVVVVRVRDCLLLLMIDAVARVCCGYICHGCLCFWLSPLLLLWLLLSVFVMSAVCACCR